MTRYLCANRNPENPDVVCSIELNPKKGIGRFEVAGVWDFEPHEGECIFTDKILVPPTSTVEGPDGKTWFAGVHIGPMSVDTTDKENIERVQLQNHARTIWANLAQNFKPEVLIQLFSVLNTFIALVTSPAGKAFLSALIGLAGAIGPAVMKSDKPEPDELDKKLDDLFPGVHEELPG